ncbi:hypothetical protein ABZ912_00815 [Nonomuraea angiospora]|uniref:hypothetical protein n=1 Tax=Nonomuraea angiospora TaxID=46172 RepID=UPI0033CB314A
MLVFKYPLFRALYAYDKETIGRAFDDPQLGFQCYRFTTFTPLRDYLRMLHENGMWDPSHSFALDALLSGSSNFTCTPRSPEHDPIWRSTPTVWPLSSGAPSNLLIRSRPQN